MQISVQLLSEVCLCVLSFDVNRNLLSFRSFATSLKKNLFEVSFYTIFFFHVFIHVYSPSAGADNPLGTKF